MAGVLDLLHGELHLKQRSVASPRRHLAGGVNNVLLARLGVGREVPVVGGRDLGRHQHLHIVVDHLVGAVFERAARGLVEIHDDSL